MTITVHNTDKIVTLTQRAMAEAVECRVWEGTTESGVPVHVYIVRIAVEEKLEAAAYEDFERQLLETRKPTPAIAAIPLRLIL